MTHEDHERHRQCRGINYRLCTALDLTKLGIVLDEMRSAGLSEQERRAFDVAASSLLALLRTANHRLHGEPPVSPIL